MDESSTRGSRGRGAVEQRRRAGVDRAVSVLERLQAVTTSFSRSITVAEIGRVAVTEGRAALGGVGCAIALLDEAGSELVMLDHENLDPALLAHHLRTPMSTKAAGVDSVLRRAPVFMTDEAAYFAAYPQVAPTSAFPRGARAWLPLEVDDAACGVLAFSFPEWQPFEEHEIAFMRVLAAVTSQALERARRATERETTLRAMDVAARMKDEFLATVSHELRTPLNAIVGWSSTLRSGDEKDSIGRGMEIIERNARALSRVVDDMLDVSQIAHGGLHVDHRSVDLGGVLDAVASSLGAAASAKGVDATVAVRCASTVIGDAARLRQAIWNIAANAVKFTPRGGRVSLSAEERDGAVTIAVSDSGVGMPAHFLSHAFDPFRQLDSSTTRVHGGLGLGLTIARHLVELHGGTLQAESAGPGHGSTFTIVLPTEARPAARHDRPLTASEVTTMQARPRLRGLRVVVADDADDSRDLVRRVLEGAGASVRAVGSAREAMECVASDVPDALVADIGMPGADGYTLIRWIRAMDRDDARRMPAVAVTGYASERDRREALAAGFQEHLAKPTRPSDLVGTVARLVGR